MVGVRQKLVLENASVNEEGIIMPKDVIDIFNISNKKTKKALIELEKLCVYGYLELHSVKPYKYKITQKGLNFLSVKEVKNKW